LCIIDQMLEDVEDSASGVQCRQRNQRRKKRGRLLYSTPKELSKSRMRRSNVVPRVNVDTSRTLDFQRTDIEDNAQRSAIIQIILEKGAEDCPEQVSSRNPTSTSGPLSCIHLCMHYGRK
jgi:hypothetical protein